MTVTHTLIYACNTAALPRNAFEFHISKDRAWTTHTQQQCAKRERSGNMKKDGTMDGCFFTFVVRNDVSANSPPLKQVFSWLLVQRTEVLAAVSPQRLAWCV